MEHLGAQSPARPPSFSRAFFHKFQCRSTGTSCPLLVWVAHECGERELSLLGRTRGARGAETPPGVGDPRGAVRRARLEVAGEAQPEEAPRSRRGVTRDVPTSRRPPRDVKTFTREPLRAREAARAKPRRSTNVLRRSALRRSGGEKPNRLGEDEAENPKTQKPKNPKTSIRAPRRAAELRGGNFYAFPRALVVEDARSIAGPHRAGLRRGDSSSTDRRGAN